MFAKYHGDSGVLSAFGGSTERQIVSTPPHGKKRALKDLASRIAAPLDYLKTKEEPIGQLTNSRCNPQGVATAIGLLRSELWENRR